MARSGPSTVSRPRTEPRLKPLPSVRRHALAALLVLGGGLALGAAAITLPEPDDGWAASEVALPELDPLGRAMPPASDNLLARGGGALPDLLGAGVAAGSNPTEAITDTPPSSTANADTTKRIEIPSVALPKAPIAELQTRSSFGFIPMTTTDGRTARLAYRRPFAGTAKPDVSVVVGGLGVNADTTRRAIETLPPEVTLSFAAHAPDLQDAIDRARLYGHEVMLELPMEGLSDDPGELGADRRLLVDGGASNLRNLDYLLSRGGGYFAVSPYGGEAFLASDSAAPILAKLSDAGLALMTDSVGTAQGLSARAAQAGLPMRDATMLVDATPDREAILRDLEALRARALAGEAPVGFGFGYPQTVDALLEWLPTLERVELAPASAALP